MSLGDFVTLGGDVAAMAVIEAVARLIPGVLGNPASREEESFADGLLEYPQYTRPADFEGMRVPEVLLSGDHARVHAWRKEQALRRTRERRPDLLGGQAVEQETDPRAMDFSSAAKNPAAKNPSAKKTAG